MRFPRNLPEKPAGRAACALALFRLDTAAEAAEAAARLGKEDDPEALHDFRVALRRLRVCLRGYEETLADRVTRKTERRVRKLARSTGSARDTEVFGHWLALWKDSLQDAHQPGVEALSRRLSRHDAQDGESVTAAAAGAFSKLAAALRPSLLAGAGMPAPSSGSERSRGPAEGIPAPAPREIGQGPRQERTGPRFGTVSAGLLRQAGRRLSQLLAEITTADEDAPVHRARIAGKRLRYLLEPFRSRAASCRKAILALKKLQDDFGAVHDLNILIGALRRCAKKETGAWSLRLVEEAAGGTTRVGRPSTRLEGNPAPGLIRLSALAGKRRGQAFQRYQAHWDAAKTETFFGWIEDTARRIFPGSAAGKTARPGGTRK